MYNGIIIIHKEAGYTSHDVVAKMRGILHQKKIGHTGTLDPQATGVLPVCLGSATKLCGLLTDRDKEYVARMLLGVVTDTQDTTGNILKKKAVEVSGEQVREAVLGFVGGYDQIPPMYSAVKVDGKKLYELARAGKEVERRARFVTIREIEILDINLPVVEMRVSCSKGTYIRTLCHDIGQRLGCGAAMDSLVRTRVSEFALENAVTLAGLEKLRDEGRLKEVLIPVDAPFESCPALSVREECRKLLENGNSLLPGQTLEGELYAPGEWVRLYFPEGRFAGVYAFDPALGRYKPVKMFPEQ